jgi:hypothetical protein
VGVLAAVLSSGLGGTSIGATRYLVMRSIRSPSARSGSASALSCCCRWRFAGRPLAGARDWPAVAALGMLFFAAFPLLFNASLISPRARGLSRCRALPLLTMLVGRWQRGADGAQIAWRRDRDDRRAHRAAVGLTSAPPAPGAAIC